MDIEFDPGGGPTCCVGHKSCRRTLEELDARLGTPGSNMSRVSDATSTAGGLVAKGAQTGDAGDVSTFPAWADRWSAI